jgi:hypothetical protein
VNAEVFERELGGCVFFVGGRYGVDVVLGASISRSSRSTCSPPDHGSELTGPPACKRFTTGLARGMHENAGMSPAGDCPREVFLAGERASEREIIGDEREGRVK